MKYFYFSIQIKRHGCLNWGIFRFSLFFFLIQSIISRDSAFVSMVGKVRDNFRGANKRLADFPSKELHDIQ